MLICGRDASRDTSHSYFVELKFSVEFSTIQQFNSLENTQFVSSMKIVGVAYSRKEHALRNPNYLYLIVSEMSAFILTVFEVCGRFVGVKVGVENFFCVNR